MDGRQNILLADEVQYVCMYVGVKSTLKWPDDKFSQMSVIDTCDKM